MIISFIVNSVGVEGIKALSEKLRINSTLTSLNLSSFFLRKILALLED